MEDIRYIKLRRATAAEWAEINPVLREGEPAWETDAKKLKVGDGVTPYSSLPYSATDLSAVATAITNAETATTNATNAAGSATSAASSANTAAAGANASKSACDATNASVTAAESSRVSAESGRVSAESARVSAESSRVSAESARVSAESTRASNEETRIENETARQSAESTRSSLFNSSQGQRAADFNTAQDQRAAAFATEQSNRATAFATEQTNRGNTFNGSEASRATTFSTNEGASTDAANANGSRWARFNASEASRAATFTGKESQRDAAVSTATALTPRVEALEDDKVSFGDYDPSLRAGVADTAYDVIADNTETETFTSRVVGNTASGHAITKGNASVKVMKGNSVVWNQLVIDSHITSTTSWGTHSSYVVTSEENIKTFTSENGYYKNAIRQVFSSEIGHKYLFAASCRISEGNGQVKILGSVVISSKTDNIVVLDRVVTGTLSGEAEMFAAFGTNNNEFSFSIDTRKGVSLIDITRMFNGDTTIIGKIENASDKYAEFLKYAPIVADKYAYNEGTLISNNATAIRSKDTNGAVLATRPTLIKSIKDSQGNVVFPNGLLKAGDVADSIDYRAGKAVKRFGVKVFDGNENWVYNNTQGRTPYFYAVNSLFGAKDNALSADYVQNTNFIFREGNDRCIMISTAAKSPYISDKRYTSPENFKSYLTLHKLVVFYELDTPIEYTFDPSHLDYPIVNGGVEELVADGNVAPVVADITYPCSQNGTIASLLTRISALESKLVSATNVTEE